jgi:chromosome partitioning protein
MILSTVSLKGGAGKTTLAVNLAVEFAHQGAKVALVDADKNNQNSVKWSGLRPETLPKVFTSGQTDTDALRKNILQMKEDFDFIIIDGTPAMAHQTSTIMLLSDLILLPIRSAAFDLWAFHDHFLPKLDSVRALKEDVDCRIVRNALRKTLLARDILEVLEMYKIPIMNTSFKLRVIYESCPLEGIGVTETTSKDSSIQDARFEISKLRKEIESIATEKELVL